VTVTVKHGFNNFKRHIEGSTVVIWRIVPNHSIVKVVYGNWTIRALNWISFGFVNQGFSGQSKPNKMRVYQHQHHHHDDDDHHPHHSHHPQHPHQHQHYHFGGIPDTPFFRLGNSQQRYCWLYVLLYPQKKQRIITPCINPLIAVNCSMCHYCCEIPEPNSHVAPHQKNIETNNL